MAHFFKKKTFFSKIGWSLALLVLGCFGCKESSFFKKDISEGIIKFKISYPDFESDNLMEGFLPKEMQLTFKNNVYKTEISAGNGIFRSKFVTDCNQQKILQTLKYWNDKTYTSISADGVKEMLNKQPTLTIIKTNDFDTIAGYHCKKAIGIYHKMMMPEITLYYTDQIAIKNFNWYNQFKDIKGVLLAYEIDQFNLRTRFRAIEIDNKPVEEDLFEVESNYQEIEKSEMISKLQKIFKDFME